MFENVEIYGSFIMGLEYFLALFFGALVSMLACWLVTTRAVQLLITGLVAENYARAFGYFINVGIFFLSFVIGVGFPTRNKSYNYEGSYSNCSTSRFYCWPGDPVSLSDLVLVSYTSMLSAMSALLPYFAVITFTLFVMHVGMARAKIMAKEN